MTDSAKYEKHYSEDGFWDKLKKNAVKAGQKVVYSGLTLYFALGSPNTSAKDKLIIYAALGYLISPIDVIPDPVPVAGFTDDLGALLLAATRVAMSIDSVVKEKARNKMIDFFGKGAINEDEINEVNKKMAGDH